MGLTSGVRLGPYEIVSLLGTGGMGQVYKARDLRLHRDVAIKVLEGAQTSRRHFRSRLEREARAAAAVSHPHICTLYDVRQEGQVAFLVMEYLEGETLATRLSRGPFPVPDSLAIATDVAEALAAAHGAGLVHRDLKPSNIMLTLTGAKLLDFGLARIRSSVLTHHVQSGVTATDLSATGMVMGTLQYMAPEQLEAMAVDHRADIFAFGAVLYEMITGRRAFEGQSRAEIIAAILKADPPPIKLVRARTTPLLNTVIKTCLAKDPGHRWQSAADLATTLKTIAARYARRRGETEHQPGPSGRIRKLVVLPLDNVANDVNEQYLADGMTECLIDSISQIGQLKVISRASAMSYRATDKPLAQIAKELGVDGFIRGSVSHSETGISVEVALLRPESTVPIWSQTYDRPLTDLFRVHGEIAETIAAELHLKLTARERRRVRSHKGTSPEINEAYLRGRYYWNRETRDGLQRSFQYLSMAVQRDPDYAAAHAAMADWYLSAGNNSLVPVPDAIAKARTAALRALKLDPGLAEAYACLGRIAMHECDLQRARAEFETSLRLNPNLVEPMIWSARALGVLSQHREAIARIEFAKQLDPVSPRTHVGASAVYYTAGDYERAVEEGRRALEFESRLPSAYYFIGVSQLRMGLLPDALSSLETAVRLGQGHGAALAGMAFVLVQAGRPADALKVLDEMRERATRAEVSPYYFAEVYLALGDVDKALAYLRRSYELRIPDMIGIAVDPLLRSLRDHPDFKQIVQNLAVTARPNSPSA